jgi:hypothetical protein
MYNGLPQELKILGMVNVTAPLTENSQPNQIQDDIFQYHEMRRRLLDVAYTCAQQQYFIQKSRQLKLFQGHLEQQQQILKKLFYAQEAEEECRAHLSESVFESAIIEHIDCFLSGLTAHEQEYPRSLALLQQDASNTYK